MVNLRKALGVAVFFLILATFPLTSQEVPEENSSVYYVKSLVINQIAIGDYGYRVTYLNGRGRLHDAYLPHEWFSAAAGQGEQIETWSKSAPYMEVYYENGAFSHVRIFVIPTYDHISWTVLRDDEDTEQNFAVDTLEINYN